MTHSIDNSNNSSQTSARLSVAELINRELKTPTRTERKLSRVLLANYPISGLEPLADLAKRAEVSHPSVLRFTQKLGFTSYGQFQTALREELQARLESPISKSVDSGQTADGTSNLRDLFPTIVCDNIKQSMASIPQSEFDGALKLLGQRRSPLYLLGGRVTDAVASYSYTHLRMLRPRCSHIAGPPQSWPPYIMDMDSRSVLLVFDIRRYEQDVINFSREASEQGARIILVTDHWLSPISSYAKHVLPTRIEAPSNWDSVAAIITLMEMLITTLNSRHWDLYVDRLETQERLRRTFESRFTE